MKKTVAGKAPAVLGTVLILLICLCLTAVADTPAAVPDSSDTLPMLYVEVQSPDADGFFEVTVSAENLEFLVCELALRYNTEAVVPVDADTGERTERFGAFASASSYEGMARIGEKLNTEKGYFLFTVFASPGVRGAYIRNNMMHFGEKTEWYRFRFRKIADGDNGFAVASIYDGGVYDEYFPDGAVVTSATQKRLVSGLVITDDGRTTAAETVYYYYSELYPKNFTKEQRLAGTVYLVSGDYAAAVDGELAAIDPQNHAVTPYEKNGTRFYPLRFVCESLGCTVDWDASGEAVTVTAADGRVSVIDTRNGCALADGKRFEGGIELVNDRTMVPAEVLCAIIGARVYDAGSGTVFYTGLPEWTPEREAEKEALAAMQYVMLPFFRMFLS